MKKIFKLLLPLLVLLLIYPNIGSANFNPADELSDFIKIETQTQVDQGSDVIIIAKRGGGGGSFRSTPSRSSGGWGSSKPKSTPKSGNKSSGSGWGSGSKKSISGSRNKNTKTNKETITNKKTTTNKEQTKKAPCISPTTKRKLSRADKKLAAKAKKEGKYHKDRQSARADFKQKNAGKYTSKYATKPATRPAHIPQTTSVNGVSYNISYNAGYGGYGYMGPGGAWMMYDMMTDMVMVDMMMNRTGYVVATDIGTPMAVRTWHSPFLNLIYFLIFCLIIGLIRAMKGSGRSSGDV